MFTVFYILTQIWQQFLNNRTQRSEDNDNYKANNTFNIRNFVILESN